MIPPRRTSEREREKVRERENLEIHEESERWTQVKEKSENERECGRIRRSERETVFTESECVSEVVGIGDSASDEWYQIVIKCVRENVHQTQNKP